MMDYRDYNEIRFEAGLEYRHQSLLEQLPERERLITELRYEFGLRTEEACKFQHAFASQGNPNRGLAPIPSKITLQTSIDRNQPLTLFEI